MDPKTKRGTKGFGDFMTLMEFNLETALEPTLKEAHANDHKNIESEKHGMPFYFLDMRISVNILMNI